MKIEPINIVKITAQELVDNIIKNNKKKRCLEDNLLSMGIYTEEAVKGIATEFAHDIQDIKSGDLDKMFDKWFDKFKKKL